jgi:E3 ubiquitin-protein ligase SH3RF
MAPMDEEGCLKFQKGMIIQVTRRVDQNWAEGKLGEAVGIFPLSFVNMNQAATALMQSYATKWRLPASIPSSSDQTPSTSTSPQRQICLQPTPAHPGIIQPKSPPLVTNPTPAVACAQISHDKTGVYIALHNYIPQKQDELELKKGSHYVVKETCQDGWLKGSCSDNLFKKGVFPGNYVMPLIYHQKMLAMQRNVALQAQKNQSASNAQQMRTTGAYTNLGLSSIPPELPQRNITAVTQTLQQQPRAAQSPLSQQNKSSENSPIAQSTQKTDDIVNKQRKESMTEMLMKKLGYNRKSNDSSAYSMDNPVFEDTSAAAASSAKGGKPNPLLQFNHMRSGSCPSRFVCPPDLGIANANIENLQFGSQRVKIRERTALPM